MAEASVEFAGVPRPGQRPGISSSAGPAGPPSPLPESLRRGLTALSESVFHRDRGGSSPETSALLSSLPLQMSLYFNTAFFPCWLSSHIAMLTLKFPILAAHNRFVAITVLLLITLIEVTRLFLGWAGNLQEKLGELTGFWMLTLLLQLPLLLFLLLTPQPRALPLELAVHLVFAAFLIFQAGSVLPKQPDNKDDICILSSIRWKTHFVRQHPDWEASIRQFIVKPKIESRPDGSNAVMGFLTIRTFSQNLSSHFLLHQFDSIPG